LIHDFVGFELICTMNRVRYLDDDDGWGKFIYFFKRLRILIKYGNPNWSETKLP
jgi:hypothetical protein